MADSRYKKLVDYAPTEWNPMSPVEIIKGAILLDQRNNRVLLQLKLCNVSTKNILSVHIQVNCFDETGEAIPENNIVHDAFQDLDVPPKSAFGDQKPIFLKDTRVRKVDVMLVKVMFTDGNVHLIDGSKAQKIPQLSPLEELGIESVGELKRIYPESNSFEMTVIPRSYNDGTWACVCGKINLPNTFDCIRCGRSKEWQLEKVKAKYLQQSLLEYRRKLEEEEKAKERHRRELEELKALEETLRKRNRKEKQRKVIWIVSISILLASLAYMGYIFAEPRLAYKTAQQKLEEGLYEDAKNVFLRLGDFRESADLVKESDYRQAIRNRETGNYLDSIKVLNQLGGYRDSSEQVKESYYQYGIHLYKNKEYKEAVYQFLKLEDYKDSNSQLTESYYQFSLAAMQSGDYKKALKALEKIPGYKDSKNQIKECKYQIALRLKSSRKELEQAQKLLKELGNYKESLARKESVITALSWQGKWYRLRYEQWVGDRKELDVTHGPFGEEPFHDYVKIDYFDKKITSFSSITTSENDFTMSGNTITVDAHGYTRKYVLQGNKLIKIVPGTRWYKVTYVREDVKDEIRP